MIDCHIHLERGPYTLEWIEKFVATAIRRGLNEIYLLEHSHRFIEFIPMYEPVSKYSDYQRDWFHRKNDGKLSINCMNAQMLKIFKSKGVKIQTASDAHCPEDVGANIKELERLIQGVEF